MKKSDRRGVVQARYAQVLERSAQGSSTTTLPRVTGNTLGEPEYPCPATSPGSSFSRLQSFATFRLLRSLGPRIAPTAPPHGSGQLGRLHHALPGQSLLTMHRAVERYWHKMLCGRRASASLT